MIPLDSGVYSKSGKVSDAVFFFFCPISCARQVWPSGSFVGRSLEETAVPEVTLTIMAN